MKGKKRISILAVLVCLFALVLSLGLMSACGNTDNNTTSSNQWYYGAEVPADTLGHEGDYYLNTETLTAYAKSEDGTWTQTAANWYYGTEEPVANLGATNDFYLNTESGALYQKKADGWGFSILTLKGEQGEKGRDGVLWYSNKGNPNTLEDKTILTGSMAGDFYIDYSTWTVYQLDANEKTWNNLGSLKGETGTVPQADVYTVTFDARTSTGAKLDLADIQAQDQKNRDKWGTDGEFITYKVSSGNSIENLPVPTLDHCAFVGWFTGSSANDSQVINTTPITRNLHLTARYEFNDTARVASMTKGGAQIANGSHETIMWTSGTAAADYKEDYNFRVIAAEADNIEIYVKRGIAAPTVWGKGNYTSGTPSKAAWNAGEYDITIPNGYFTSTTALTQENFEKYLESPTNVNVYTIMVVKNGDTDHPLASFTTHFASAANPEISKPFTEQGKLADLTDEHGASWSDIQGEQTLGERFIISHDALVAGAQPTITMKVGSWYTNRDSEGPQYEAEYIYTLGTDGVSFTCELGDYTAHGSDAETWTPSGADGWDDPWGVQGHIKVTAMKLTKGFLEFTVEIGGYEGVSTFTYNHNISLVYELDDARLDVLDNKAGEDFGAEAEPTEITAKVYRMTDSIRNDGQRNLIAGTPGTFAYYIRGNSMYEGQNARHYIKKANLDFVYLIIDGVRADIPLGDTQETIITNDVSFTVEVKDNSNAATNTQINVNLSNVIYYTEGTKNIELHYSYLGVERVYHYSRYVVSPDACPNAGELVLKAWEKYLTDHSYIQGEAPAYTLNPANATIANNANVQKLVEYINAMYEGTIDYETAKNNILGGPTSSFPSGESGFKDFAYGTVFPNSGMTGASSWATNQEIQSKQGALIEQLKAKYASGSYQPTAEALYTYFSTNILKHFDSTQYGMSLQMVTYIVFFGYTAENNSYAMVQAAAIFYVPEVAMNFVELAFEKYGASSAAEFYDGICSALSEANDLNVEETAAYEALAAAHAALQSAGGLESAPAATVKEFMDRLDAFCKLYAARELSFH